MEATLKRVKKLSEHIPRSESEYNKAIRRALAELIEKLPDAKHKGRILEIIRALSKSLKISTDVFIKEFKIELGNDIWHDYKSALSPSWFQTDEAGIKAIVDFKEIYWHGIDSKGKHHHTLTIVDKLLMAVKSKIDKDAYSVVMSGYINGIHPNDIARDLKGVGRTAKRNLRATVRTMYSNAQNKVQMQMLEDNQEMFECFEYVAKLDTRTTEICRSLDEKRWYKFDDIPKDETPSLHFNCRSIIVGIVNDDISVDRIENLKDGSLRTY